MLYLWDIKLHYYQRLKGSIWYIPVIIIVDLCLAKRSKSNNTCFRLFFICNIILYSSKCIKENILKWSRSSFLTFNVERPRKNQSVEKYVLNALKFNNFPACESSCIDFCNLYFTKRKVRFVNCNAGLGESLTEVTRQVNSRWYPTFFWVKSIHHYVQIGLNLCCKISRL